MAGNDVRIEQKDLRVARVFIDGNEVKGVQNVNYSMGVDDMPIIKLEFIPENLNFDKEEKAEEKELKVKISITDTDTFKDVLDTLLFICMDERIDKNIRQEYLDKIVNDILRGEW